MKDAQRTATNINRTPAGLNSNLIQEPACRQLKAFRLRYEALLLDVAYRRRNMPETLPLTSVSAVYGDLDYAQLIPP